MRASPESLSRMRRYFTPGASGRRDGREGSSVASPSSPLPGGRPAPSPFRFAIARPPRSRLAGLLLHFFDEVVGALLQALADLEAHEAAHLDVLARLRDEVRQQAADVFLALGVLDPDLIEQTYLLGPLGELALDDLGEDRRRLTRLLGRL